MLRRCPKSLIHMSPVPDRMSEITERMKSAETAVRALYEDLLAAWNRRDGDGYAALFAPDGMLVGFDGSQVPGSQIADHVTSIFAHDAPASCVSKVREVRPLAENVVLLRAIVGIIPAGRTVLDPAANSVQSMVAQNQSGTWRAMLFHDTPARYHGRPDLVKQHLDELRQAFGQSADRG
jgi:uncharacterized protein (TIGR02246 family)